MFHNNYGIYIGAIESTLILGAYYGRGIGKTQAKKKAAYMVLIRLLKSAGIRKEGWEQEYYS